LPYLDVVYAFGLIDKPTKIMIIVEIEDEKGAFLIFYDS
jgi:hypothetical protein